SYCWECKPLRDQMPRQQKMNKLGAADLEPNEIGMIVVRGKNTKGRRWESLIELDKAVQLVNEQAAVVIHKHLIHRLYHGSALRELVFTRDQYTCFYCGKPGNTIDHITPRSKGGHSTPLNCVCACKQCNRQKGNKSVH